MSRLLISRFVWKGVAVAIALLALWTITALVLEIVSAFIHPLISVVSLIASLLAHLLLFIAGLVVSVFTHPLLLIVGAIITFLVVRAVTRRMQSI